MGSHFVSAQQAVVRALDDDTCPGLVLVVEASRDRVRFCAWAIEEAVAAEDEGLRTLLVTSKSSLVKRAWELVRYERRQKGLRDLTVNIIRSEDTKLPRLKEVNLTTFSNLVRLGGLTAGSIELLIVDEPGTANFALRRTTDRAAPLFTLVLISQMPPANWPWSHLGEPQDYRQ